MLERLSPGIAELAKQKDQLVGMLERAERALDGHGPHAEREQGRHRRRPAPLAPILQKLADTGSSLPKSLQILLTFPFTDKAGGRDQG